MSGPLGDFPECCPKTSSPGKPTQNTWDEHLNRTDRTEHADGQVSESPQQAREMTGDR